MADSTDSPESPDSQDTPIIGMDIGMRRLEMEADLNNPVTLVERVYQLWWRWADFQLYIVSPFIDITSPPQIIKPELIAGTDEYEFVYPIHDSGSKLAASKSAEMYSAGLSMHRLYMTVEKMIYILVERLKREGISKETEVQVSFGGHLLPQRKAFESIINLAYNVVVTNFDPGEWGERYLQIVKQNADRFGYPSEAPRDTFKQPHKTTPSSPKR